MFARRVAALSLALAACTRSAPKPDANYDKAQRLYQQLFATQLDDAYGDPQMEQVVALLRKVDPASADGPSAKTMLGAIQSGRETLAKQRADREAMAAAAGQGIRAVALNPDKILAASAPAVDAGPPADPFGAGASLAELNASSGGCLVGQEPFTERGTGKTGTVYRLSGSPACARAMPGFVGQAVLVSDGKVYRRLDDATVPKPVPIEQVPADAGPVAASPPARAAPQDAGPTTYALPPILATPGGPQPEETIQALPDGGLPPGTVQ